MEREIIIANDLSEIINVTRFIESAGVSLCISSNMTRRVCLAIEEAVSNIIHHAYPSKEKSDIKLKLSHVNGDITCMITHNGLNSDPTVPFTDTDKLSLETLITGGQEFFLIFKTMDEVAFHSNGSQSFLMLTKRVEIGLEEEGSFNTNICRVAGGAIITIEGRLDTVNARKFEFALQPLLENCAIEIILNCEDLTYVSSSGLRCFILMQKKVSSQHGQLIMKNMQPEIRKIFDMTGCSSLFNIH